MQRWYNFGDVNFLEHGGTMVRRAYNDDYIKKYPSFKDEFQAFCLHRIPEDETKVLAYIKNICITDWDDKKKEIEEAIAEPWNDHDWVREIAEYVGLEPSLDEAYNGNMYPEEKDYIITEEQAKEWLERDVLPYIEPPHKVCKHCGVHLYIDSGILCCPYCGRGIV